MRNVGEQATAEEARSTRELYELLSCYYGRVLRVQSYSYEEGDPGYRGGGFSDYYRAPTPEIYSIKELIGPVGGLSLKSRRTPGFGSGNRSDSILLKLKYADEMTLDSNHSTVSVLQEDTNSWKLLHVGEKFSAGAAKLEG